MNVPSGRLQFFALEAGDYLERLALLAGRATEPGGDDFVRLTRALRGAALMAGLSAFSQAASGLEQVAKAYRDRQWTWSPARSERLADAVEELKRLVRRATEWTDADTRDATRLARDLVEGLSHAELAPPRPAPPADGELPLSVRDFIAREGALVAGSLEHAAQAIELGEMDQAADLVLRRLQPLRGLAALPALIPLSEFLDAIELTLRAFRLQAAPATGSAALRRVAAAVSHLARDIAAKGSAPADTPELVGAATMLLETFGAEDDVVDVRDLFRDGDPAPIVYRGEIPLHDLGRDSAIELVGLGDRLRQAADQLGSVESETGRLLVLYGLLVDLRPVARRALLERPYLEPLLRAITTAVATRRASHDSTGFSDQLREAADTLARAAESRDAAFFSDELEPLVQAIDALAPDAPPPERVVPIEALAPDRAAELTPFEQSFSTLFQLDLEARQAAAPKAAAPPVAPPGPDDIVPIETLLYSGRRALERADEVRLALSAALRQGRPLDDLEPLVSELIDLVPLALAE